MCLPVGRSSVNLAFGVQGELRFRLWVDQGALEVACQALVAKGSHVMCLGEIVSNAYLERSAAEIWTHLESSGARRALEGSSGGVGLEPYHPFTRCRVHEPRIHRTVPPSARRPHQ